MENLSSQTSTLVKGLGVVIGEIAVGVNGPFLFERFGLNVPVAIASGVLVGAAIGFCIATVGLALWHREPALSKTHTVTVDPHPHRA